ncbi:MAG: GNAT family N-acetyltransferase [Heyndrickxia sp.]
MEVIVAKTDAQYEDALAVRKEVFVGEQNVPTELEIDEYENEAVHFVAYDDGEPVGAGRFRRKGEIAKVERICVLKSRRGEHIGEAIMKAIENEAIKAGFNTLVLNAQTHAIPFYEKLGYGITSEEFQEAGIPHVEMRKHLS